MAASTAAEWSYVGKAILAPMVRVGTLPMRLTALSYGADIVYGEELIDFKLVKSHVVQNELLGTTDIVLDKDPDKVVFRTCPAEAHAVVFQLGTADAGRALQVGEMVAPFVRALDVNMGCPKHFSLQGGMGAALIENPEVAEDIMKTLVRNLPIPVTCKIRLRADHDQTIEFARRMEATGIAALGVHGRRVCDKKSDPANWDGIRAVAEALSIPVIANGDIWSGAEMDRVREETGCASVMLARPAMWNPSVFLRQEKLLPVWDVARQYVEYAVDYDNHYANTKYVLNAMVRGDDRKTPEGKKMSAAKSMRDICEAFDMIDYLDDVLATREQRAAELGVSAVASGAAHGEVDAHNLHASEIAAAAATTAAEGSDALSGGVKRTSSEADDGQGDVGGSNAAETSDGGSKRQRVE